MYSGLHIHVIKCVNICITYFIDHFYQVANSMCIY